MMDDFDIVWANDLAAALSELPETELALLFTEAETMIRELKALPLEARQSTPMPEDSHGILTAIVEAVVNRLSARSSRALLALQRKLDEERRIRRLFN